MLNVNQELQKGRCRIIRQLNREKTNSLYEVYDKVLAKNVLLKEILFKAEEAANSSGGEALNNAFAEEAKFLSEIKHDGFLQILGHFSEGGARYLVMESIDGKNLGELIKNNGKLVSPASIMDWGKQILDALDYLHKKTPAVLYFDLKPTNLYLTSDGKIKLLAAGISGISSSDGKIKKQAFDKANLNYSPLELIWEKLDTASQRVILNGFDEESEQSLMKPPDVRCDVYSLGATLYHLLTGKLPVNALERSIELLEENPDPLPAPNKINSNIAVELSDVLIKSLKIKREDRFQSALEMHGEFENVFVLLRERKIRELRSKTPATPDILSLKPTSAAQKNRKSSYETPQIKSRESEQLELIKQKLREAEAQRLSAEQRAAEAERRLNEMEKHKSKDYDILELTELPEFAVELPKVSQSVGKETVEEILHAEIIEDAAVEEVLFEQAEIIETEIAENDSSKKEIPVKSQKDSSEDFDDLFAAPQKDNKFFKRMAATVIGLLILGGGIWGVFNFLPMESPNLEVLNQTVSAIETPIAEPPPTVEATPEIEAETTPELSGETEITEELPEAKQSFTETREKPVAVKQKTPAPQIATAKQPERKSTAPAVEKKKKVTVDDLINDTPTKKKKVTIDDLINDN